MQLRSLVLLVFQVPLMSLEVACFVPHQHKVQMYICCVVPLRDLGSWHCYNCILTTDSRRFFFSMCCFLGHMPQLSWPKTTWIMKRGITLRNLSSLKITRRFWGTWCVKRREFAIVWAPCSSGCICIGHVPAACKSAFNTPGRSACVICFVRSDSFGGRSVDAGSEWHCFISPVQGVGGMKQLQAASSALWRFTSKKESLVRVFLNIVSDSGNGGKTAPAFDRC